MHHPAIVHRAAAWFRDLRAQLDDMFGVARDGVTLEPGVIERMCGCRHAHGVWYPCEEHHPAHQSS